MSGTRDQRIEIFAYSDTGTDGRAKPTYTRIYTAWGRLNETAGRQRTVGERAVQHSDGQLILHGERRSGFDMQGIARIEGETEVWKFADQKFQRDINEFHLDVLRSDAEVLNLVP